eukprot:1880573-Rhodomonas_salina.1
MPTPALVTLHDLPCIAATAAAARSPRARALQRMLARRERRGGDGRGAEEHREGRGRGPGGGSTWRARVSKEREGWWLMKSRRRRLSRKPSSGLPTTN